MLTGATDLAKAVRDNIWFRAVGSYTSEPGTAALTGLAPWGSTVTSRSDDSIADSMGWLPSARDAEDPFYGAMLARKMTDRPGDQKRLPLDLYQAALASLRTTPSLDAFLVGPHDFLPAAKAAAAYACRAAGMEMVTGVGERWQRVLALYLRGFWPCALHTDGRLVVF